MLVVKLLCSICALALSSPCLLQDFAPAVICSPFYNTIFSSLGSNHSQQHRNMLWSFPSLNKTLITVASSSYDSIFLYGKLSQKVCLVFLSLLPHIPSSLIDSSQVLSLHFPQAILVRSRSAVSCFCQVQWLVLSVSYSTS